VVVSTTIFTEPGNLECLVKVSSISMASSSSSMLNSDTMSSVSQPSRSHGGEPDDRKMPAAAACVSVGELREADGLFGPRELRAMSIWEGLVVMAIRKVGSRQRDVCV
jgi:hypothetical protein